MDEQQEVGTPPQPSLPSGVFVKGTLREIRLTNFMSYDALMLRPSPGLNAVMGPNGSGKSSIFLAAYLALGGQLAAVQRQRGLAELVGLDGLGGRAAFAEVAVTLQGKSDANDGEDVLEVQMKITSGGDVSYALNGTPSTRSDVARTTRDLFNIATDNAAQFLAQDTVKEFTNASAQDLLKACLNSLEGRHAESELEAVRAMQRQNDIVAQSLHLAQGNLEKDEKAFQQDMKLAEADEQRRDLTRQLHHYDCRRHQLVLLQQDTLVRDRSQRKEKLVTKLTTFTSQLQDEDLQLKQKMEAKVELRKKVTSDKSNLHQTEMALKFELQRIEADIRGTENLLAILQGHEMERLKNLEKQKREAELLQSELSTFDVGTLRLELGEVQEKNINALKNVDDLQYQLEEVNNLKQITLASISKMEKLLLPKQQKIELLKQRNLEAHAALVWLRENCPVQFNTPIHDPIRVTADIKSEFTQQIENELKEAGDAFLAENPDDAVRFVRTLQNDLGLNTVSVASLKSSGLVKSPNETTFLSQGLENVPLSITHHFGLDQIPVYEEPPSDKDSFGTHFVSKYYVKNQLNKVFQSKFSGKIIHLVEDSPASTPLKEIELDMEKQVVSLKEDLKILNEKIQQLDLSLVSYKKIEGETANLLFSIREKLSRSENLENEVNSILKQVLILEEGRQTGKVEEVKLKLTNLLEVELPKAKSSIQEFELKKPEMLHRTVTSIEECKKMEDEILALLNSQNVIKSKIANLNERVLRLDETISSARNIIEKMNTSVSNENMEGFPVAEDLLHLNLAQVESSIVELKVKLGQLPEVSNEQKEKFQERRHNIAALKKKVSQLSEEMERKSVEIASRRSLLIESIEKATKKVDQIFSSLMFRLGFNGECVFHHDSPNVEDFGLHLLVKFRSNEEFRVLNTSLHSGGEKSVTAILFIMALQSCGDHVPFRFVDEINQGMDKHNELEVWKIVNDAMKGSSKQFFLLCQKLPPTLEFDESFTGHICFKAL